MKPIFMVCLIIPSIFLQMATSQQIRMIWAMMVVMIVCYREYLLREVEIDCIHYMEHLQQKLGMSTLIDHPILIQMVPLWAFIYFIGLVQRMNSKFCFLTMETLFINIHLSIFRRTIQLVPQTRKGEYYTNIGL